MKLFFWRNNRAIDQRAILIADDFFSQAPPDAAKAFLDSLGSKKISRKNLRKKKSIAAESANVESALWIVISRVMELKSEFSLGVYGKARLHMKFMSRLTELGYSESLAKQYNEIVLLETP